MKFTTTIDVPALEWAIENLTNNKKKGMNVKQWIK